MKLIILDRDGVINEDSDNYIRSPDEWQPIPGSIEAIARLNKAGYTVAVATNQSGLGRGYYTRETLTAIHNKMISLVEAAGGHIACICFCPHTPDDNCNCRKPATGLVRQIESNLNCTTEDAWFVGDTITDIQVATACNCRPVLVKTGKGQKTLDKGFAIAGVQVFESLKQFADFLI